MIWYQFTLIEHTELPNKWKKFIIKEMLVHVGTLPSKFLIVYLIIFDKVANDVKFSMEQSGC